MLGFLG